jgi:hypothetical protein
MLSLALIHLLVISLCQLTLVYTYSVTFRAKISFLFMCQGAYVDTFKVFLRRTSLSAHITTAIKRQIFSKCIGLNQANIMRIFILRTLHMILLRLLTGPLNWIHDIVGIYVATYRMMGEIISHTNLFVKSRWKGPVSKSRLTWKYNIKTDCK